MDIQNSVNASQRDDDMIRLKRKVYYLVQFLASQDLYDEAAEYVREHLDEPTVDEW